MERPVVLAMSPRVGRWNHRYFAPTRSRLTEEEATRWVGDALDSSRPDPSIVHAQALARQSSTGRMNPEVLLVRDPRLSRCPDKVRADIESILAKHLPDFGRFIVGLTDEETASDMLIRHKGFDTLSQTVLQDLDSVLAKLPPAPEAEAAAERREPEPAPRATKAFRLSPPAWAVLLGIVALAVVALPVIRSMAFPQRGAPAPNKDDADLREFYFAILGMGREEKTVEKEFNEMDSEQRIAAIFKRLKDGDSEKSPQQSQPSNGGAPRLGPADKLRQLLAEYYMAKYGSKAQPPNDILSNPDCQDFRKLMGDAFKDQKVDLAAFLDDKPGREALEQFNCTGPSDFHKVFNAFVELQGAIDELKDRNDLKKLANTWQREFIRLFPMEKPLRAAPPSGPALRLYRKEDGDMAEAVVTLLKGFKDTPPTIKGVEGPNPVAWLCEKLTRSRDEDEWVSDDLRYTLDDREYGDAFQKLKALGKAWLGGDWR